MLLLLTRKVQRSETVNSSLKPQVEAELAVEVLRNLAIIKKKKNLVTDSLIIFAYIP
jgi:hypothetical protein